MSTQTAPREPLVDVRKLKVDYLTNQGLFSAVKGIDFEIGAGEILGLAGESGCGKSTVAFSIMRLHRPPAFISDGNILVDGQDVLSMPDAALRRWRWRTASMVFQSAMNSLNPVLTIFEQFRDMITSHTASSVHEARALAEQRMKMVGIPSERLDDYSHQLSGGMRQRVALAMALTLEPKLIIMDEPTTALDVVVQREIMQEILALREQLGFSILFITHDLALMSQFADRIAIMLKGEIVETGTTHDIIERPSHAYTRRLWQTMPRILPQQVSS